MIGTGLARRQSYFDHMVRILTPWLVHLAKNMENGLTTRKDMALAQFLHLDTCRINCMEKGKKE